MIDGIQATYLTPAPDAPPPAAGAWEVPIRESHRHGAISSGPRVSDVRRLHLRGIDADLKPLATGCHALNLNGSLHKYHNAGSHNADQFSAAAVGVAVSGLCDAFGIAPDATRLHGLEVGVNLSLDVKPSNLLNKAVCFKGRGFVPIDPKKPRLGLVCHLSDYSIKLYDKTAQSGHGSGHVLRLEVKVNKMRHLARFGLQTLADLQSPAKLRPLLALLLEGLAGIIWTNDRAALAGMSAKDREAFLKLANPRTWEGLEDYEASRYNRRKLAGIMERYYIETPAAALLDAVCKTWAALFEGVPEAENAPDDSAENSRFFTACIGQENTGNPTPINVLKQQYKNSAKNAQKSPALPSAGFAPALSAMPARRCAGCGAPLTGQKTGSRYCSALVVGSRAAHRCRNTDSNRRRTFKNRIKSASMLQNFLSVTYRAASGTDTYTDTFHPSELANVPRAWLDRITEIQVLPHRWQDVPESYTGEAARLFAQRLQAPTAPAPAA